MQELALKLHTWQVIPVGIFCGLAHDQRIAHQLYLGSIAVGQGAPAGGGDQPALRAEAANARLVNLQRIGVRVMPRLYTVDIALEQTVIVKSFHRELAHEVIRLMAQRLGDLGRTGSRRIAHQPVSAQHQQAHEHDR